MYYEGQQRFPEQTSFVKGMNLRQLRSRNDKVELEQQSNVKKKETCIDVF